jgi:hypothetical protein
MDAPNRDFASLRSPYSCDVGADPRLLPASRARELHRYRVKIQLALVPSVDVRRTRLSLGGETMYGESSGGMRELVVMTERWDKIMQFMRINFSEDSWVTT